MGNLVSERTIDAVIRFLQRNTTNNQVKISLQDMGQRIGYSATTVMRALRKLQEDGVVEVEKNPKQLEASTIVFHGTSIKDSTVNDQVSLNLMSISQETAAYINKLHQIIEDQDKDLTFYRNYHSRIIKVTPIDDNYENVLLKRQLS